MAGLIAGLIGAEFRAIAAPLVAVLLVLYGLPAVTLASAYYLAGSTSSIAYVLTLGSQALLLGLAIYASLRSPGKRTLWDRASGTMVRYRTARPAR